MAVVVITGANSGFGLEGALAFARNGDTVVATVRTASGAGVLQQRFADEGLRCDVEQLDMLRSDTFAAFGDAIASRHGAIDVLVNNAGIHRAGALEDIGEQAFRDVIETNCTGPLLLTRALLPIMRAQRRGVIIMMSSLSGIAGLPGDLPYTASKFALDGATEALRHEVDRCGLRVALVEAGMYRTAIMAHNYSEASALPDDYPPESAYRPLIEWQLGKLLERMPEALDPADVGRLFVEIAHSTESRLRWPADELARRVLSTMFAQTDEARDRFLRDVAGSDWWSCGASGPGTN